MAHTRIALLPGLDGTARLFKRFIAAAPPEISCTAVELPARPLSYEQFADEIAAHLPHGPLLLLAESFSGPLAVAVAERVRVSAFVFCNSFVRAPRSRALGWIALPALFKLPPRLLLRRYLLGAMADDELVREVTDIVGSVPADILASRVRMALAVDKETAFARSAVPALYIRGTEDRVVPESAWRSMAALRPMSIARVSGPHLLLQANPSGAWRPAMEFLDSLPAV